MRLLAAILFMAAVGYLSLGLLGSLHPQVEDPTPAPKPHFLESRSAGFGMGQQDPRPMVVK